MTHLEKFISFIPVPYYWGWSLIAFAFLSASCLILMQFEGSFEHIDIFLILSVIIALEGPAISWAHKKMKIFEDVLVNIADLPEDAIIRSLKEHEAEIFDDRKMIIFAAFFIAFVHMLGIDYHAVSFSSALSYIAFNSGYYFAVYLEGVGVYALVMTAWTVHSIGKLPMKFNVLLSDFQEIGILYSKFTIYAACAYVAWGIFHMVVPPLFSSWQMISWFSGFAVVLLAYFTVPQYSIHRMMASTKKEKIDMFSSQMRAALDGSSWTPENENTSYLKDMLSVQNQLHRMCEWPFGAHEMLRIALVILIPLIIVLLEIRFGIIK
jgi:hypothetical protein